MAIIRKKIMGPPGTGKTHRLLELPHDKLDKPYTKKYEMEKEPWQ